MHACTVCQDVCERKLVACTYIFICVYICYVKLHVCLLCIRKRFAGVAYLSSCTCTRVHVYTMNAHVYVYIIYTRVSDVILYFTRIQYECMHVHLIYTDLYIHFNLHQSLHVHTQTRVQSACTYIHV